MDGSGSAANERDWADVSEPPELEIGTVHVWKVALDVSEETLSEYLKVLSREECLRAEGMKMAGHRSRYVASRGVLRRLLGAYLDRPSESLKFDYLERGKPILPDQSGPDGLRFNLSHSRELTLVAVAVGQVIGVDVEYVRKLDRQDRIVERFFSPEEIEAIKGFSEPERRVAFFSCWTRKEAYLKAIGAGLGLPLNSFSVSADPLEEAPIITGENAPAL